MVEIYVRYEGGLRCVARHAPSGTTLQSDAPVDNHGRGESFSPTDLLATALGTCMLTVMGILAQKRGWQIDGLDAHVVKHMTKQLPRRVELLTAKLSLPSAQGESLNAAAREELEQAALNCPVRLSLHPQIEVPVTFDWGQ
jgi:putative redox protein